MGGVGWATGEGDALERIAQAISLGWPRGSVMVGETENDAAEAVDQREALAAIIEFAGLETVEGRARKARGKVRGVARQHEEGAGLQRGAIGEREVDPIGEVGAAQVEGECGAIL